jgi:hypothetical protein
MRSQSNKKSSFFEQKKVNPVLLEKAEDANNRIIWSDGKDRTYPSAEADRQRIPGQSPGEKSG